MKRLPIVQWCCVAAVTLGTVAGAWAQGTGLRVDETGASLGNRLSARVSLGGQVSWSGHSGIVLGDYYFEQTRLGSANVSGGFRATSGVLLGQRQTVLGAPAAVQNTVHDAWSAMPYVGVGWSSVSARRGWGFTADLGLTARGSQGGLRIGHGQTLDELLRDLRLMPTLAVGVSYSF